MKKVIIMVLMFIGFAASAETKVQLKDIAVKTIYQNLIKNGHKDSQLFSTNYQAINGLFERNEQGQLIPATVSVSPSAVAKPNLGDMQNYTTTETRNGAVYQYHYKYNYMVLDVKPKWVLSEATTTFLHLSANGSGQALSN